ncbi:hypothetical protein [Pedobacter sp. BS3]|nr:hypothetical protein [Pedobacter sp. BS3]
MKKIAILLIAAFGLTFTACKKDEVVKPTTTSKVPVNGGPDRKESTGWD